MGDCCTNTSYTQVQNSKLQNCIMVVVGKYLWKLSSLSPLLKQVHLEHAEQDCIQAGLNISSEETVQSRQSVLVLCHPQSKDFFLILRGNFLCFHLGPMALVLLLDITDKCLDPSSWHPALRHLY